MTLQSFLANFVLLAEAPNTASKLRELIIQLAVEGRLVAQDASDEPASKLLERINGDKERLARTKNGRKKAISHTNKGDGLLTIPRNWEWVRLDQITDSIHYGYTASANQLLTNVRLLRITDIQNGKVDWATVPGCEIENEKVGGYKLATNDILIARTGGTIGKSYLVENLDKVVVFASYLIRVIPNRYLLAKYLKIFLESELYWKQLLERSVGTGQPNVNATSLKSLAVPLPPIEEQNRIITMVKRLMQLCDELEVGQEAKRESRVCLNTVVLAPLNKAASLTTGELDQATRRLADNFDTLYDSIETVNKLRATILQLATQGKLVRQDPNDEPGDVLLRRIRADKEQLVREGGIKRAAPSAIPLKKPMFCLPLGWIWARFGDVFLYIEAGWSPECRRNPATDGEWGVLKVSSVSWDNFRWDENKALPLDVAPRLDLEVATGDFLISRANTSELVAKSVVVKVTQPKLMISDKVLRVHFSDHADKEFYNYFNNTQLARDYYRRTASGTSSSMKNISQLGISLLPVPVPPLAEQKRIVVKVNQLMSLCDQLEAKLRQAEADSERLMNAAVKHVLECVRDGSKDAEEVFA